MTAGRIGAVATTLAFLLAGLLALAAGASAKIVHEEEGTFPLSGVDFLAVDNSAGPSSGDLYVGNLNSETFATRVYQTDANGTPTGVELDGAETPAGSIGLINFESSRLAEGPAVDGSTGANAGGIYVPDVAHGVVDLFDESGQYVCQITGSATPSTSECAGLIGSETPSGGLEPISVAVDQTNGDVAVGDASGVVYEFNDAGKFKDEITDPHITLPGSLAFDSVGSIYVVNGGLFAGPGEAAKFNAGNSFEYALASNRVSVGVDPSNDHVYLGGEGQTLEFDSAGEAISAFGSAEPAIQALSIDVSKATNQVYVAPLFGEGQIWSGDVFAPTVATGVASGVGETSATLAGNLDPEIPKGGAPVESCAFEYGETEAYGQSAPCAPPAPYANPTDVSGSLTGLAPATTYHYRLIAANADAQGHGEDRTFATLGPASITSQKAIARTRSATVTAEIDTFGYETSCQVQYVEDASFLIDGYASAATRPCAEALAPGFGNQQATATLGALKIGTTYHFRFLATNQAGPTTGEDSTFSTFAIESFSIEALDREGQPYAQAGGHPYEMRVSLAFSTTEPLSATNPRSVAANLKTVRVQLPPGLIGNPTATPTCTPHEMTLVACPPAAQLGTATVFATNDTTSDGSVYDLTPPVGVAAEIGARFNSFGTVRIDAGLRTGGDYGVNADTLFVTADEGVERVEMTLWGVPADESHDGQRQCRDTTVTGCASGAPLTPFLTNPTACTGPLASTLSVDTWQDPGNFVSAAAELPAITGCDRLGFKPMITVQPETRSSESPTGLEVDLRVPQNQNPTGLAEANLKDVTVDLPAGLTVNPSGATGLAACTPAQIELHGPRVATCPDAAKIGTVEVDTPLVDHPLPGAVYVAAPHNNPFGALLAIYVAIDDPVSGVVVKLAGEVKADPQTGRLSTTFSDNPQLPFQDFKLDFFGGPQAALMTPQTCGAYTTTAEMTPWTAPAGEAVHRPDSFQIGSGPAGSRCANTPADAPHSPSFSAGIVTPLAGLFSPFVLNLSREDGSQRLSAIDTQLPPGLLARLAGTARCSETALAKVAGRSGAEELASPACPTASEVGSIDVAVGAGAQPYRASGKAYLTGPYGGAPLGLAILTPALAGPFDLGNVVVRAALYLDRESARITARSDALPTILQGIPLDLRSIALRIDRPHFTLNPTSCKPMSVTGAAFSVLGLGALLSNRFQVGGCSGLPFKPRLSLALKGPTKRTSHPRLIANLIARPGEANIARAQVKLPKAAFLDNTHIETICTRVQFAADTCPPESVYGRVSATTPLLDSPLSGPVYLRSSNHALPDLLVKLKGTASQPIEIDLTGRTDSVKGALRNTFEAVPDAPVSKFHLELFGGRRGLVELSSGFCKRPRATVRLEGQNSRTHDTNPVVRSNCKTKAHS